MSNERKHWQAPAINAKSVREALGSGETAGPMAPGLIGGPNSMFGPPESITGSAGRDTMSFDPGPNFGPTGLSALVDGPRFGLQGPLAAPEFGPPVRSAISGPPTSSEISFGPRGPSPAPAFGPPVRSPDFGPPGVVAAAFGSPVFAPLAGPPVQPSDVRLKEDITPVGASDAGIPLYTFRYRNRPGLYRGVMAQDVLKTRPDAVVVDEDGFYKVDYAKLGIEFRRVQ